MKLSNYLGGTLPTEAGKASRALRGVGFAAGAVAAAFIGWEIGTIIHDEIIDPLMQATHEMEVLSQSVASTMGKDTSKRSKSMLYNDLKELEKLQKGIREGKGAQGLAMDYVPGMNFFKQMQNFAIARERGRLTRARDSANTRGNIARYSGYGEVSDYVNDWSGQSRMGAVDQSMTVAKVENHTHVTGKTVSSEDISRASKKGVEDAFKKIKRNHE
jgi:hypothetical protein